MTVQCNKCGEYFTVLREGIMVLQDDGYNVTFFVCPHCKEKYLICIFDKKMHELLERRRQLEQILRIARAKKFRAETIRRYVKEYEKVKADQKAYADELKPIGEEIIKRSGKGEDEDGEEHNSDQSG